MQGLAYPIVWSIDEAPAGATIGMIYSASGVNYGGYGDLIWYPQEAFSSGSPADFVINGTGQDETTEQLSFSSFTSLSTSYFVFANSAASSEGNGTYDSPLQSLAQAFGASSTTTTFPGANLYLMGNGTYPSYQMSDAETITINPEYNPSSIMGIPGNAPVIDITDGGATACFGFGAGNTLYDFFAQGFSMTGVATANDNQPYRHFWPGIEGGRWTFHNISWPNVFAGQNSSNNSTCIYWSDPGYSAGNFTNYIVLKGLSETGRVVAGGQSYGLACMYGTQYGIAEFCTVSNSLGVQNLYLKASNRNWSRRFNTIFVNSGGGFALANGDQINDEGASNYEEQCYNLLVGGGGSGTQYLTRSNLNDQASAVENTVWYRNTLVSGSHSIGSQDSNGPFSYLDEVIQWGTANAAAIYYYVDGVGYESSLPLPSSITNTNTECQAESSVVDADYNLTGSYASFSGMRGWEVK